jgi:hypothetical protein
MVRVGGGYMKIEEFVNTHQSKEIDRLKLRMNRHKKTL